MMMEIQRAKYYVIAIADIIILQIHRLEWLDESIKTGSLIIGLVVGVLTAIKFYLDIIGKVKDDKLKDLELRRKSEEVRRFFEQKYGKNE